MGPDPLGWFKTPINSTADFKKMKYRAPPGITGEIFKEMGVAAVALPGGEIVPAAQRGVIDAAEWIGPADDLNLGLQTVWKHYYLQGLHQSTDIGEILINKTVWDKLPPDLKEIIRTAAMASMMETYTFNVYRNAQAIVRLKNEFKVEIHDTPKDFFPEFVRATNVVLDRYCREGRVLQGGARLAAQFREDRRPLLDQDQRPVLEPRQRGPRRAAEVAPPNPPLRSAGRSPRATRPGCAVPERIAMKKSSPTVARVTDAIDTLVLVCGKGVAWLILPMVLSLVWEVTARYGFNAPTEWAYDMTFMLYGTFFMLGSAWTLQCGGHIRTDSFYSKWTQRTQARVDLVCYVVFFFPAIAIFAWLGSEYFWKSFQQNERIVTSPWLPIVWPFKFVMPASAVLLLLQGISECVKCWGRAFGPGGGEIEVRPARGRGRGDDMSAGARRPFRGRSAGAHEPQAWAQP